MLEKKHHKETPEDGQRGAKKGGTVFSVSGSTHGTRAPRAARQPAPLEMGKADAQVNTRCTKALHRVQAHIPHRTLLPFLHLFLENRKLIDLFAEVAKIGLGRQMSYFSTAFEPACLAPQPSNCFKGNTYDSTYALAETRQRLLVLNCSC